MENNPNDSPLACEKEQGKDNNLYPNDQQQPLDAEVTSEDTEKTVQSFEPQIPIEPEAIIEDTKKMVQSFEPQNHVEVLDNLLLQIKRVDFRHLAGLDGDNEKLSRKHYLVWCIEHLKLIAVKNNWNLCTYLDSIYLYNGAYWKRLERTSFSSFLGKVAEKMGVDINEAKLYKFQEELFKQFVCASNLSEPKLDSDTVLINFKNGTFEVNGDKQELREPRAEDFITYQLPFNFDQEANTSIFKKYLDTVLPEVEIQMILAEYLGSLFLSHGVLKLEKALLLYGGGANGKSVLFEIVTALIGRENITNFSLQKLTDENGYHRAMLANKLLNYASEINGKLESAMFKLLASGEPVEARLPYGNPQMITKYGKLIFNCNELPKDVEHTLAYFRRFIIIPFDVTIPNNEQDKDLSKKIINNELSGVFNWVLAGLKRLLENRDFTFNQKVHDQIVKFKKESDTVQTFIEEEDYITSIDRSLPLKDVFSDYRAYCASSGYRSCAINTFGKRLRNAGFSVGRDSKGSVVFIEKKMF